MNTKLLLGIMLALFCLSMISHVSAAPVGPTTLTNISETTWDVYDALTNDALAGNITQLDFTGSSVTRSYQGYIGNISGYIVLGNANNQTLYDWSIAEPQGEIYAVRSSTVPSWTSVACASTQEMLDENVRLNINVTTDEDAINNTFVVGGAPDQVARFPGSDFNHTQFYTANQSMARNACPVATLYNSSEMPSSYFKEVLLSDKINNDSVTGFVIYTGILAQSSLPGVTADGYDGRTYDFQMIVGEDGHGADTGPTATQSTYYFYLELE